jgi:hypothetical protein
MPLRRATLLAVSILWLLAAVHGMAILADYENTPGAPGDPPTRWPASTRITRVPGLATLVMAVHPHCPCSRASIGELNAIMARAQGRVRAHLLFVRPPGVTEGWEQTDLWRTAAAIPGVALVRDDDGVEAERFHASTSGHVALYDQRGRLVFSGGITASRGHHGDNAGKSAVIALLTDGNASQSHTPVFGCSLLGRVADGRDGA